MSVHMQGAIFYQFSLSVRLSVQCRYCVKTNGHIDEWTFSPHRRYKFPRGSPQLGKGREILQLSPFISETIRDRAIVTIEHC